MTVDFCRAIDFFQASFCFVAQAATDAAPANKAAPDLFTMFLQNPLNLMLIVFVLFFFIVLWPQQRQMRAQQRALAEALTKMKKNDRVITSAGIHGTILQAAAESPTVTIRIDEGSGAKMTVNRESIAKVLGSESKSDKDS